MNGILYSMFISLLLRMSVITVFILAIKAVFRYKLSAKMHSLIWLILCVQLIFCLGNVRIETDISMYNYIGSEAQDAALETIQTMQTSPANHGFDIRNLIAYTWFFRRGNAFYLVRVCIYPPPIPDKKISGHT